MKQYQAIIRDTETGEIGAIVLEGSYDYPVAPPPEGDVSMTDLIDSYQEHQPGFWQLWADGYGIDGGER